MESMHGGAGGAAARRERMHAGAGAAACGMGVAGGVIAARHKRNRRRAAALAERVRVVQRCSPEELACVLSACVSGSDTVDTIRCAPLLLRLLDSVCLWCLLLRCWASAPQAAV